MSIRYGLFSIIIAFVCSLSAFAQDQGIEAARSSSLTSISLPSGAARVLPGNTPPEVDGALDKLVAEGGGKLRRSGTEVLLWTGSDLKKAGSEAIVNKLAETLRAAGWQFEVGGTESGITLFSVTKTGAGPRAIIGFHGEQDGTLLLAWTELKANTTGNSDAPETSGTVSGNTADYEFTTPSGWTRSDSADKIVLTKDDNKTIAFLPLMDSSGDLERDADRILWQVLKGYNSWHGSDFREDYGTFERGKTVQGLEYFQAYRYAKKASDPNDGFIDSTFDAIILLVKLGNKVAVVVGRQPFQSVYARDSALSALDLILYDLKFKSVNNNHNLKSEILGHWSAAGGSVALVYNFNANGTFDKGGAAQFRTSRDRYTDNVTTTSYGSTDTYSLAGNVLTENYKRSGQVVRSKVRVYQTKYDKDPWKQKLGLLPVANPDGGTVVMSRE